jgi:hypothetical protein
VQRVSSLHNCKRICKPALRDAVMVQVALTEVYGNFGGLRYKNVPLEMWSQSKKKTHQQMKMQKKKENIWSENT